MASSRRRRRSRYLNRLFLNRFCGSTPAKAFSCSTSGSSTHRLRICGACCLSYSRAGRTAPRRCSAPSMRRRTGTGVSVVMCMPTRSWTGLCIPQFGWSLVRRTCANTPRGRCNEAPVSAAWAGVALTGNIRWCSLAITGGAQAQYWVALNLSNTHEFTAPPFSLTAEELGRLPVTMTAEPIPVLA